MTCSRGKKIHAGDVICFLIFIFSVSPKHKNRNKIEERVAQNIREIREESTSSTKVIKPLMPEGFMPKSRIQSGTAQARLERGRQQRAQNGSSDMSPTEKSSLFPTGACYLLYFGCL